MKMLSLLLSFALNNDELVDAEDSKRSLHQLINATRFTSPSANVATKLRTMENKFVPAWNVYMGQCSGKCLVRILRLNYHYFYLQCPNRIVVLCHDVFYCVVLCCVVSCCAVLFCAVLWCDVMWCEVMRCDVMRCNAMQCDAMQCDAMRCDAMWCGAMRCDVMWCDVMWCDVMLYCAMLCYVMPCITSSHTTSCDSTLRHIASRLGTLTRLVLLAGHVRVSAWANVGTLLQ